MNAPNLDAYREAFNRVGWFIPPYVSMGFISRVLSKIQNNGGTMNQDDLEGFLAVIYSEQHLAALVTERLHKVPFVCDYRNIIAEAIAAHFHMLDHVAVAGLLPCIEGIARKLAASRNIHTRQIRPLFTNLAEDSKTYVTSHGIGAVGEIVSMLDSLSNTPLNIFTSAQNGTHFLTIQIAMESFTVLSEMSNTESRLTSTKPSRVLSFFALLLACIIPSASLRRITPMRHGGLRLSIPPHSFIVFSTCKPVSMVKAFGWLFDTPKHGFQAILHWLIYAALLAALLYGAYLFATHKYAWIAYLLVLWIALGGRRYR